MPALAALCVFMNLNSARSVWTARQRRHAMLTHRLDSLQQIAGGIRFHNVASCSGIQGLTHHLGRIMLGDKQNLETRLPLLLN